MSPVQMSKIIDGIREDVISIYWGISRKIEKSVVTVVISCPKWQLMVQSSTASQGFRAYTTVPGKKA
jgi:hypothetical protein